MLEIINVVVNIDRYQPLAGGLSTYAALPLDIQRKKAVVIIQNTDERCFLRALAAARHPVNINSVRPLSYRRYINEWDCTGVSFPITLHGVEKFEKLNNIEINVYGIECEAFRDSVEGEKSVIVPLYLSKNLANPDAAAIHLLMVECDDDEGMDIDGIDSNDYDPRFHFARTKNLSRLVRSQLSHRANQHFFCDRCLCHFKVQSSYDSHRLDCMRLNKVRMLF